MKGSLRFFSFLFAFTLIVSCGGGGGEDPGGGDPGGGGGSTPVRIDIRIRNLMVGSRACSSPEGQSLMFLFFLISLLFLEKSRSKRKSIRLKCKTPARGLKLKYMCTFLDFYMKCVSKCENDTFWGVLVNVSIFCT